VVHPLDPADTSHLAHETQVLNAGVGWIELRTLADCYYAQQQHRVATGNRMGAGNIDPTLFAEVAGLEKRAEQRLSLAMRKTFRRVAPEIHAWVTDTPGLGETLFARLLGLTGQPCIAEPYHWDGDGADRTLIADETYKRTVSQLWSFCGHGDPTRRHRKGITQSEMFACGNPKAKMLAHLIAEGCMKTPGGVTSHGQVRRRSPYRDTYEAARARYDGGRPDWSDGHRNNAALRFTAKTILKDLWVVAEATL